MSPLGSSKSKKMTVVKPPTLPMNSAGTVTVSASAEETKTAIAALLSLGSDFPQPDDDATAENALLVPINPVKPNTTDNIYFNWHEYQQRN